MSTIMSIDEVEIAMNLGENFLFLLSKIDADGNVSDELWYEFRDNQAKIDRLFGIAHGYPSAE